MHKLTLKEVLQDALICEKFMLGMYEQFLKESSNPVLLKLMLKNFEATAENQHQVFVEMRDRNMYPVENAELMKVEKAITTLDQGTKVYDDSF